MPIIKEYILPFIFIVVMAAILSAAGFILFAGFVLLAFRIAVEVSFETALTIFFVGLGLLLLLAIRVIYKVYRKDV